MQEDILAGQQVRIKKRTDYVPRYRHESVSK
jgi:hypothetical protein